MIKFRCGHCRQKLGVPDEYAGRRVRCNKCGQPCTVPRPQADAEAATTKQITPKIPAEPVTPSMELDLKLPQNEPEEMDEEMYLFAGFDEAEDVAEDPTLKAIQMAARDRAAGGAKAGPSRRKSAKGPKSKDPGKGKTERTPLSEMVPDMLRLPLSLVLCVAAIGAMILLWIVCGRAAGSALGFFALLVPLTGAAALRLFMVNRTFLLAVLGTLLGGLGIGVGKLAIAKHVVIPYYRQEANAECLVDLDALLADEKLQIPQSRSAKSYATDSVFLLCTALISLVDDDLADPIQVRGWALHILRVTNKTDILALVSNAGSHSGGSQMPELDAEGEAVFAKAWERMFEWEQNETALRNTRKYFPALMRLTHQCKRLRILGKPKEAMQLAFIASIGLLDSLWILMGMGFTYFTLAFD